MVVLGFLVIVIVGVLALEIVALTHVLVAVIAQLCQPLLLFQPLVLRQPELLLLHLI